MINYAVWSYLFLAILTEVAGMTAMKLSHGFTVLIPSVCIFVFYSLSFAFLTFSLKKLEVGFAYAIWSGLGTLLVFVIGVYFFNESLTIIKAVSLGFIVMGVIGLKQS